MSISWKPRKIFGLKGEELIVVWIKLCKEELQDLHSSPAIIRAIISRSMRLAKYVAHVGEKKTEGDHIDDPDINGSILFYHVLKVYGKMWPKIIWFRTGKIGGIL
jgi:hypothetical protein